MMTTIGEQDELRARAAKRGGAALVAGAMLNFLRMIPLAVSDGFSTDELPSENFAEAATAATLRGWHASHVMAPISLPLLMFGLITA